MNLNETQKKFINLKLNYLSKSKFRNSFKLNEEDKIYITNKGLETIEKHCNNFIKTRLATYPTPKDGKQTPMRGHPVFIAQHATATCCRTCLNKWHKIPTNRELSIKEISFTQALIIEWIKQEL